jgi:hypothetical protein
MTMRTCILVALLLHVLVAPAWADDPALASPKEPSARRHFKQGNRLYRAHKLEEAIAEYQAGAAIEPAPVFDYNLGQSYRKLGRPADAVRHYERFLENGRPEGELRELVTGLLRELREDMARAATPRLHAMVTPAPAVVTTTTTTTTTTATPAPAAAAAPPPGAAAPPARAHLSPERRAGPPAVPAADLSASAVARRERWYADRLGWSLVASGVVLAGGAMYLRVRASGLVDDVELTPDEGRRSELHDAAQVRGIAGAALGVGSAALIAAGAFKLAVHASGSGSARTRAASWSIGISARGAAVLGRF